MQCFERSNLWDYNIIFQTCTGRLISPPAPSTAIFGGSASKEAGIFSFFPKKTGVCPPRGGSFPPNCNGIVNTLNAFQVCSAKSNRLPCRFGFQVCAAMASRLHRFSRFIIFFQIHALFSPDSHRGMGASGLAGRGVSGHQLCLRVAAISTVFDSKAEYPTAYAAPHGFAAMAAPFEPGSRHTGKSKSRRFRAGHAHHCVQISSNLGSSNAPSCGRSQKMRSNASSSQNRRKEGRPSLLESSSRYFFVLFSSAICLMSRLSMLEI